MAFSLSLFSSFQKTLWAEDPKKPKLLPAAAALLDGTIVTPVIFSKKDEFEAEVIRAKKEEEEAAEPASRTPFRKFSHSAVVLGKLGPEEHAIKMEMLEVIFSSLLLKISLWKLLDEMIQSKKSKRKETDKADKDKKAWAQKVTFRTPSQPFMFKNTRVLPKK